MTRSAGHFPDGDGDGGGRGVITIFSRQARTTLVLVPTLVALMVGGWQASGEELTAPDTGAVTAEAALPEAGPQQFTAAGGPTASTIPDWITPDMLNTPPEPVPVPPNRTTTTLAPPAPPAPAPNPAPAPTPPAGTPTTTAPPSPGSPTGDAPNPDASAPAEKDSGSGSANPDPSASTAGDPGSTGSEFEPFLPSEHDVEIRDHPGEPASLENFVYTPRSGPSSTAALVQALRPLQDVGLTPEEAAQLGFGRFPVGGLAHWSDDWLAPRSGGRQHQGNDIFSGFDVPVRAPADGILSYTDGGLGGKGAYVTEAGGTFYYLAHLNAFVPELSNGTRVAQGQVIGFNGDTGNARGGAPHVHFEMHPSGGSAVNPKETLDGWVADALAAAPDLVAQYRPEHPRVALAAALTRHLDQQFFVGPLPQPEAPLLWASSVSPAGSALRLAEANAARMADSVDWQGQAGTAAARWQEYQDSSHVSRRLLDPLTPPGLALALDDEPIDTNAVQPDAIE